MILRMVALVACFLSTAVYLSYTARAEPTPIRQPLKYLAERADRDRPVLRPAGTLAAVPSG